MDSKGTLYIVSLPIGNIADLSAHARQILCDSETVLCEDTRHTLRWLQRAGITVQRLSSYHDHTSPRKRQTILDRLHHGANMALISDAGTPLVNDPGYRLVRAVIEAALPLRVVPGPSAVLAALVLSGLPSDRFHFAGFVPSRSSQRRRFLEELVDIRATVIVFESARRLVDCLQDMMEVLGSRQAAVLREMTKTFEEAQRGDLLHLHGHFAKSPTPRGEISIVFAGSEDSIADPASILKELEWDASRMPPSEAARRAARRGMPRRQAYRLAVDWRARKETESPENAPSENAPPEEEPPEKADSEDTSSEDTPSKNLGPS